MMFKPPEVVTLMRLNNSVPIEGHLVEYNGIGIKVLLEDGARITTPWHNIGEIIQHEVGGDDGPDEDESDDDDPPSFRVFINDQEVWRA